MTDISNKMAVLIGLAAFILSIGATIIGSLAEIQFVFVAGWFGMVLAIPVLIYVIYKVA